MESSLTAIQRRVLRVLVPLQPPWTLTGGGALAGFYLGHRTTKDVDLFFIGERVLGDVPRLARSLLVGDGLTVEGIQDSAMFCRLRARDGEHTLLIDLVAEPVLSVVPPERADLDGTLIVVDSGQEILGNKLGALYSRWEIRDLVDVKALVEAGYDLDMGLRIAATKDGGFSRIDLAWVLRELKVAPLAAAEGYDSAGLSRFADELRETLLS